MYFSTGAFLEALEKKTESTHTKQGRAGSPRPFVCAGWSRIEIDSCSPPGQADFRKKMYIRMGKMFKTVTAQSPGVFSAAGSLLKITCKGRDG